MKHTGQVKGNLTPMTLCIKVPFRGFRGKAQALTFRIHPPNLPPDETYGTGEREALIKIANGCLSVETVKACRGGFRGQEQIQISHPTLS